MADKDEEDNGEEGKKGTQGKKRARTGKPLPGPAKRKKLRKERTRLRRAEQED